MFLFKLERDRPVIVHTADGPITFKVFSSKGKNKYQVGVEAPKHVKIERPEDGEADKDETQEGSAHHDAPCANGAE